MAVSDVPVDVVRADITTLDVDAIVNAANRAMRGGAGVDGAIHAAGGPGILRECIERFPTGLSTGDAGWTTGGDLRAQYVIHVVGPNWHAGQTDPALLESCYHRALEIADELGVTSIAFPLVSAGTYGWPLDAAAGIAVGTVRTHLSGGGSSVTSAVFAAFGDAAYEALTAHL